MKVLIIAPHPDDESIGCGGAVYLHTRRGDRVSVVFMTSGEMGLKHVPREEAWRTREAEARKAAELLSLSGIEFLRQPDWLLGENIKSAILATAPILEREKPELIYLPHVKEWHPDHQACLPIIRGALKKVNISKAQLRCYEIWTPLGEYDHVEDISAVMPQKLKAVCQHRSQVAEFAYDRAIAGLNQYRGVIAGKCQFAEVFQTIYVNE
jgi:LmbE family N-acetylglucosaminyl deacetylase